MNDPKTDWGIKPTPPQPDTCQICGAAEVDAMTPRTVYTCGSSDYDRRPGSFQQGPNCKQQSAAEWVDNRLHLLEDGDGTMFKCLLQKDALELAQRCDEWRQHSERLAKMLAKTLIERSAAKNQLAASQAEAGRLREAMRTLSKLGTGPCGGGGALDSYSRGMQEAEAKVRKFARSTLTQTKERQS